MKLQILAAAALLAAGSAHAGLEKELPGEWQSLCKALPDNHMRVTSSFTADGSYQATTVFYGDAECKKPSGLKVDSSGKYRLGNAVTTEDGRKAREIDIQVEKTVSGGMTLPGGGQQITQIIAIEDGKLMMGEAPNHLAITGGQRPKKLNPDFYSSKQ